MSEATPDYEHHAVQLLNTPDQWTDLREVDTLARAERWATDYCNAWDDGRKVRIMLVRCYETEVWSGKADEENDTD